MPKSTRIIGLAIGILTLIGTANAEVIYLKGGDKVEGQVLERTEKKVKIDVNGVTLSYDSDEIEKIENADSTDAASPVGEVIPSAPVQNIVTPNAVLDAASGLQLPANIPPELIQKYKETFSREQAPAASEDKAITSEMIQKIIDPVSVPQAVVQNPAPEIPIVSPAPEIVSPQSSFEAAAPVPVPQTATPAPVLSPIGLKEELKAAQKEALTPLPAKESTGLLIDPAVAKMNTYDLVIAFIEANGTKESLTQMFQQILAQATPQDRERYGNQLKVDEIVKELVPTYSQYFNDEDLRGLITFYRSPLGRKLLSVAPNLTQDSVKTSAEYFKRKAQFIESLYPSDTKGKQAPVAK